VNAWFSRLAGAASEGSFSSQEAMYASHRTSRDYVWNTLGITIWGMVFPILTVVVTQLSGVEQAGMFSMAFVVGTLLMIVANYGVRTYQVSDLEEEHSFSDYQVNRWVTCVAMVLIGLLYCLIRGYADEMFTISLGVYFYKMIDGLADVYEGRLQQKDKLYLAGVSQALRSVAAIVVFSLCLLITRNLTVSCIAMGIAALATFIILTLPLALFETPKSRKGSFASVGVLFKQCFPLFVALFMYALIDNMPKFVMEGVLSYDNQLYFNALYFPAQSILLATGLIYKPLLVRLAGLWADPLKRRRFDLVVVIILVVIVVLSAAMVFVMGWFGLSAMSFLYGIDFDSLRGLCYIMLVAGGITAAIDFLYQVITVLRQQKSVVKLYAITFGFSLFVPILLVNFTGLPGAVIGYLIIMCILLVLLVWEYLRIRFTVARDAALPEGEAPPRRRPSELRAERERIKRHRGL
jgi:O-antigen/teichoic acid export membrane protein